MNTVIRPEAEGDAGQIEKLIFAAFRGAPHSSGTEHRIVDVLRQEGQLAISMVAEEGAKIVGHAAVSPVTISGASANWFGLGPVAVEPSRQRMGVGSRLVGEALKALRAQGAEGCVVLGEPSFYGRFGFRGGHALVLPGVPSEYFMAIAFRNARPAGEVAYHRAFGS